MSQFFRVFLAVFTICLCCSTARAGEPNGCGSGWNVWLVPDSIPLARCDFASCCDDHDRCYGRCEGRIDGECAYLRCKPGGDLYGSKLCERDVKLKRSIAAAALRKSKCDNDFYDAMMSLNKGKAVCEALAIIYRDAVKEWGEGAFVGFDEIEVPAWNQNKEDYDKAIREFLRSGTDEQFKAFVEGQGGVAASLRRPLRFDPVSGLINIRSRRNIFQRVP